MASNEKTETEDYALIGIALIIVGFLLFHFFLRDLFVQFVLWVKFGWIWILNQVHPTNYTKNSLFLIETYKAKEWSNQNFGVLVNGLRWIVGLPLSLILLGLTFKTRMGLNFFKYKRIMDGVSLTKETLKEWPWLAPVLNKDLIHKSLHEGEWAMAKRPVEFSKFYQIYDVEKNDIDKNAANLIFSNQLGALWRGHQHLPKGIQVFLAAMLAHINDEKDVSVEILSKTSLMFLDDDFKKTKAEKYAPWDEEIYPLAQKVIKKHIKCKRMQFITRKHAYESTVLTQLLSDCREHGILPASWFGGWMRPHYRYWYFMFEDVGRQTPTTEASGVHAHRLAENMIGRSVQMPMIEKVSAALSDAVKQTPVEYDDELPAEQRTDLDKGIEKNAF